MFAKIFVSDEAIEKTKLKFSCTDEAIKLFQFCAIKRHFCLNKHIFPAMKRSVQKPVFWSDAAIQYLRKSRKCIDYSDSILLSYFVLSTHLECLCLGWPYAYTLLHLIGQENKPCTFFLKSYQDVSYVIVTQHFINRISWIKAWESRC